MAVFPSFKLTKKGEELLNRCIGEGKVLTFTKIKIGNGVPVQDWRELTDIQSSFKEFPVLETSVQKDQVLRIKAYFDNKGFLEDKKFKEIGVFVKLEGLEGEFLYSYTNAGDTGDIIPAENRGFFSRTLDIANYIGYATNITFNIEQVRNDYDFNTEAEVKVATFLKAGDRIRLWGRLVQGDIQIRHGIVTSSNTSLTIDNGLFVQLTGEIVVNTIEDLKNLKGAIEGTVVEVLGYYTVGDGAGHKRTISNADDGSGVQLANSLWANIVHNGEVNVSWFGLNDDVDNNTNKINLVLSMDRNSFETLTFPSERIKIKKLDFENFVDKKIKFNNTTFLAYSNTQQDYCVRFIKIANTTIEGQLTVWGGGKTNYNCGVFIDSENEGGRQVNVSTFDNITSMWFKLGFRIGSSAANDSLLSENSFSNFKTFYCARALEFNGSQNVNTFTNCNFVTGGSQAETSFGLNDAYDCITINGGAPTFIGGEIVAHTTRPNQSVTIRVNPCDSAVYGKTYPKIICSGVHIETGKILFCVNKNTNTISNISSVVFNNCGGYIYLNAEANFSEIRDTSYEGLVRIKNSNFYSQNIKRVAMNLYSMSSKAKLDIDLSCFGQGFVQGKLGVLGGIFKENNHLIFKLTSTLGVVQQGDVNFVNSSVYDMNYADMLKGGKLVIPKGVKTIVVNGIMNKQTLSDIVIRKNNEDFAYSTSTRGNLVAIIPVQNEDVISLYSYGSNTIENFLVNVYVDVELEYDKSVSKLEVRNPMIEEKMKSEGVYNDFISYMDEKTTYDNHVRNQSDVVDGIANLNVIEEPVPSRALLEFKEKYLG